MQLLLLLDYEQFYGTEKTLEDARELLKGIPSATLLTYISNYNVRLYLSETSERGGLLQAGLADSLLSKCGPDAIARWVEVIRQAAAAGNQPMMFWRYSNLLFYGLIFSTYNSLPYCELNPEQAQQVFDAYLIVNLHANKKLQVPPDAVQQAADADRLEDVMLTHFLYQKDFASTTDFGNQVVRGVKFYEYLESQPLYQPLMAEFYAQRHVSGFMRMFRNLLVLFQCAGVGTDSVTQRLNMGEFFVAGEADEAFIDTLCINDHIPSYREDDSFTPLRNRFLFKAAPGRYLLLDVSFLLDQFYKAQVFAFSAFLRSKKVKVDFLSDKGKNFTEEIYLPLVLQAAFPTATKYFGAACVNSAGEELCDAYIREGNKVCLIEFKDVLLNASAKNNADQAALYAELDKKFVVNQQNSPKGITQLWNAILDVEARGLSFDPDRPDQLELYPVVVYTDNSFGAEGLNKRYKEQFQALAAAAPNGMQVKDVTFVSLSFFELREYYLAQNLLNLFAMFDAYHQHTQLPDYRLTPFEVFARFYTQEHVPESARNSELFTDVIVKIIGT
ncbi:hypothetical protein [Hymenobacter lucidus]|uniref:PD-(D/E)XK nuclease superfamily protein n=1 Tax=Hymenobacter lucidus TaxID=2880930 RepID=A0ABS8AZ47_9BACT|nr:hypothetical protein [Hymenobacter lucidus]MCB2411058.1 hypothetical protein [Hymenobacter lucidus]